MSQGTGETLANAPGGPRTSRKNRTAAGREEKARTETTPTDRVTVVGPGDKQAKPAPGNRREPSLANPALTSVDREKAMEALRQQKINPAKKDLVSDFYENPAPGKPK